jgi:hypothetical protein
MYPYMNEDVAWQRLQDMQREMENSRLWAANATAMVGSVRWLVERLWLLGGLAARRAPRRRPTVLRPAGRGRSISKSDAA